ncbi:uncharacterized protein LOC104582460 [Brachypodium distachyon]|uniref:Uncharacterized protein n=1 Tax=Brachypodium distachyon TaxID=15368 RepID=I1HBB1_BRADI|nr:uncharacterized protein LOC104582460 [Brachypodium distachyon]XP_024315207.1 uncharacterized protein LOC104582460 [Brachypodium distachyon]KQK02365.1 hypothetical protein BRADI_2g01030v3 [Brachypodium distachyon]PNT69821.1 hypothetical protein BRADI_2g01030v3 [Brachypodium distachyon]|eukprot:XP_010230365.1 uncharacterized protein LOC104582460 [Brachypodium distachyon]
MARLLLCSFVSLHAGSGAAAAPLVQVVLVALVVAAAVVSLCTSRAHAKRWRRTTTEAPLSKPAEDDCGCEIEAGRSGRKQRLGASLSGIGGRAAAAAVAKMASWRKKDDCRQSPAGSEEEDGDDENEVEAAVWRKGIIMGDKCRPLQFSGHIAFDSHGNPLKVAGDSRAKN